MLLIKTKLRPSNIHGLGLFADENICSGQEVWRFQDGLDMILPLKIFESFPRLQKPSSTVMEQMKAPKDILSYMGMTLASSTIHVTLI